MNTVIKDIIYICSRLEHMKMHEKHKGHESMHAEMILILFATLIISQIALVKWRQVYPNSYHVSIYCVELTPGDTSQFLREVPQIARVQIIYIFISTALYTDWDVVDSISPVS